MLILFSNNWSWWLRNTLRMTFSQSFLLLYAKLSVTFCHMSGPKAFCFFFLVTCPRHVITVTKWTKKFPNIKKSWEKSFELYNLSRIHTQTVINREKTTFTHTHFFFRTIFLNNQVIIRCCLSILYELAASQLIQKFKNFQFKKISFPLQLQPVFCWFSSHFFWKVTLLNLIHVFWFSFNLVKTIPLPRFSLSKKSVRLPA